jgi:hypothetical protein
MSSSLGIICDERFAEQLQLKIKNFIGSKTEKFVLLTRFSGAEPTMLELDDVPILLNNDYFVSKKGSGLRTFLFLLVTPEGPAAFLVWKS